MQACTCCTASGSIAELFALSFAPIKFLENPFVTKFMAEIAAALIIFVVGLLIGKYRERKRLHGKSLDEYDFYPYASSRENFAEFSLRDFRLGIH